MTPYEHHKRRALHGITATDEILLDLCRRWPAPGCTMADMKRLALQEEVASLPTLHTAIHRLLDSGLMTRKDCKYDKRAQRIFVTAAGKKILEARPSRKYEKGLKK